MCNAAKLNWAREILKELFGQSFHVTWTLIDGVLAEGRIARNKPESLVRLIMKMQNYFFSLTKMKYEADLNALHTLEAILRCLPADIQQRWAEETVIIGRLEKEPNFTELTEFIRNRAKVASSRFGQLA
ncbi:unnamed protein product [Echinostoma caproni]|uniref:Uncharacterized protein n=1 Tax=Echinostoma caproni TaxID=27848 RepID=A0A183A2D9_9TREM|nr:unnamed protein product [Echinostoma caproni]